METGATATGDSVVARGASVAAADTEVVDTHQEEAATETIGKKVNASPVFKRLH